MFTGVFTAIVTPFNNGKIDEKAFRDLIEWQIQEGIDGIVVSGSTGEGMTINDSEWERLVRIGVEQANNRVPIIAGAGSNSTEIAIKKNKKAYECGALASLQVTPYYNKPMQEGLYLHFKAIAESEKKLPVILYNVPGRTSVNMLPETVSKLAKIENIVGIKEASGNLEQIKKIIHSVPKDFVVLSGEDSQNLAIYDLGGVGTISITSNIVPSKVSNVYNSFKNKDYKAAKFAQEEIEPLNKAMFIETNPIPVKTALAMMGRVKEELRLPLTKMGKENRIKFEQILKSYKLI